MRKLSDEEARLLSLIAMADGKCRTGPETTKATHKLLQRLVSRGDLAVELIDDGALFTLTPQGRDHG
jgi:hypothetical protein